MYYSDYNIIVDLENYPAYSIIHNLFNGKIALLPRTFASELRKNAISNNGTLKNGNAYLYKYLKDNSFIYSSRTAENKKIAHAYSLFKKAVPSANPSRQYQFIMTYQCNLSCVYCFQKKIRTKKKGYSFDRNMLNKAFEVILDKERQNNVEAEKNELPYRRTLISLVGGEPLIDSSEQKKNISYIVQFVKDNGFIYSITTNGVALGKFLPLFEKENLFPQNIQVTIDGTKEVHDKRRIGKNGASSFEKIIESVDLILSNGGSISLRINLDDMNVDNLYKIGDFIYKKGWTKNKKFSAYLAPVTDHSLVNKNYKWINGDASLLKRILDLYKIYPELGDMFTMKNFRGFQYIKQLLSDDGKCVPTMWRCEAILGQLIFDPAGDLYTCFEGAGNEKAKVGVYYPRLRVSSKLLERWKLLNSFDNQFCKECSYKFICAGGCPWYIIEQNKTECLPIKEELELAWNYFAEDIISRKLTAS